MGCESKGSRGIRPFDPDDARSNLTDDDIEHFCQMLRMDILKQLDHFPEIEGRFRPRVVEGLTNFDSCDVDISEARSFFYGISSSIDTWRRISMEQTRRFLNKSD